VRAVVQRVSSASVTIDDDSVGAIELGLLVYVGVAIEDGDDEIDWLSSKLTTLRIFPDDQGRFAYSVVDVGGQLLVVSQFTLYGDTRRGRRPSFTGAASPEIAAPLLAQLIERLRSNGVVVATGRFGAHMQVDAVNDGPATIILDSDNHRRVNPDDR